jgi:hypothetical protein
MALRRFSSSVLVLMAAVAAVGGVAVPAAVGADPPAETSPADTTPTSTTPVATTPAVVLPGVFTGGPDSITQTGAGLNATLDSGGGETTYRFEYGTSANYGLATTPATISAAPGATTVRQVITGLSGGTEYHYRVVATNSAGTNYGQDAVLKTIAAARVPSVATHDATAITKTDASLAARINPQGLSTDYYFEWGATTSYGSVTPVASAGSGTATADFATALGGLSPNTTYHFRVVATNATGTARGRDHDFTTQRDVTGISIRLARSTIAWSSSTVVTGTVAGNGAAGVKVSLMRQDFPYALPPAKVAEQTTGAAGSYVFSVGPLYTSSRLSVVTQSEPAVASSAVTVHSKLYTKLSISKKTSRTMQLTGYIYPATPKARASLQRRSSTGRWIYVSHPKLSSSKTRSSYRVTVSRSAKSTTRYRVVVTPNDGGAHSSATTHSVYVAKR